MKRIHQSILLVALISSIFWMHCDNKNPMAPSAFEGIWRSEGYGYIVEVRSAQLTVYEVTSVSLFELGKAALRSDKFSFAGATFSMSRSGDKLIVSSDLPSLLITFTRIPSLPAVTPATRDPEKNFEILWHAFAENYAFFSLRNVNWNAQYQTHRPQVNSNTTDAALFNIMSTMLRPLEDGHVSLSNGSEFFSPGIPHPLADRGAEILQIIEGKYLNGNVSIEGNGRLRYGKLTDAIGYLNILEMEGFSESDDPAVHVSALKNGLDKIVQEFKDLKGIVIDVRFNGGGADGFSLIIASRFADQKRLAFSKQGRKGEENDFTPLRERFVEPDGAFQFTQKIVLLTSRATFSAAEVFTMSLMPFPYVSRIGEPTGGGFSDILGRNLPNGWSFGLSNERYFSHEMVNYEKIGIPPHIEIFMTETDLAAGKDGILEAALKQLQ